MNEKENKEKLLEEVKKYIMSNLHLKWKKVGDDTYLCLCLDNKCFSELKVASF